jgi:hypothetical protein
MLTGVGADIVVSNLQEIVALVEVKNVRDLTRTYAIKFVSALPRSVAAKYLLVISQEKGFLWTPAPQVGTLQEPQLELDMRGVFATYQQDTGLRGWLRGGELEPLAFDWLARLTRLPEDQYAATERALEHTGFMSAIRGAFVTMATGA